jgi:hypothetical protein
MAESAALLVDEVLPEQSIRQWVLSFPFQLRFIRRFAPHPSGQLKLFNASLWMQEVGRSRSQSRKQLLESG